jgi:hypothetical protein
LSRVALAIAVAFCAWVAPIAGGTGHAAQVGAAHPTLAKAWCTGAVSWRAARAQIGEPVRVKGRVVRSVYASRSAGKPTFLDLGNAYPKQNRLTILIWGRNRRNFPSAPERMFRRGRLICAQGFVRRYRGVPQIEVALWDAEGNLLSF